jgi:glycosyltransferase involved in cell wall biosynthesis
MKILVCDNISNKDYLSGEAIVSSGDISSLESLGHDVVLFQPRQQKKMAMNFLMWPIKLFFSLSETVLLRSAIKKHRPDIVHFHTVTPYFSLFLLKYLFGLKVPVVQTIHNARWLCVEGGFFRNGQYCNDCVGTNGFLGVIRGCGRGYFPALILFLVNIVARSKAHIFRWVDRFIMVSNYVYEQHLESGFPKRKIIVRNNGINLNDIKKYQKTWGERQGVVYAGRVSVAKGSAVLKHIIPKVNSIVNIVGDGPELKDLRIFCQEHNYEHVKFWGKQSHERTLKILGSAICTLVPSQCGETFSLVAAESLALGTPVIASDLGGLSELINNSKGGALIQPKDFDVFVDTILNLFENLGYAENCGQMGKKYVYSNLSMSAKTKELIKIYKEVLKEKAS